MNWTDFRQSAPELATRGEDLLRATGLCLVGTIRADGWPRISPCEVFLEAREIPDDGTDPTRPRPSHLFAVDIDRAAYISFGTDRAVLRWDAGRGLERIPHPNEA